MTKAELVARQLKLKRSSAIGAVGFLVIVFAVIFGNKFVASFMDRGERPLALHILYGATLLGFVVGAPCLFLWSIKRRERRFGMVCPTCGNTISGVLAHIAVASDRCGYCGTRLFKDETEA